MSSREEMRAAHLEFAALEAGDGLEGGFNCVPFKAVEEIDPLPLQVTIYALVQQHFQVLYVHRVALQQARHCQDAVRRELRNGEDNPPTYTITGDSSTRRHCAWHGVQTTYSLPEQWLRDRGVDSKSFHALMRCSASLQDSRAFIVQTWTQTTSWHQILMRSTVKYGLQQRGDSGMRVLADEALILPGR